MGWDALMTFQEFLQELLKSRTGYLPMYLMLRNQIVRIVGNIVKLRESTLTLSRD